MAKDASSFRNILVIHFGQLGDVVLGLPALRAIREKFAGARITLIVGKPAGEVTQLAAVADEQIIVDRVELRDGNKLRSIAKIFRIFGEVRRRRFDFAIDLHSLSETNLFCFLAGIRHRLYANRENRSLDRLCNFDPRPPMEDKTKHVAERYFDVLRPLGIDVPKTSFRFSPDAADISFVRKQFLRDGKGKLVGIFPGAGHASRCWSLDNFSRLAGKLADDGFRPVVMLGPEEAALRRQIIDTFPKETVVIDGLSITQFIAAASQLDVFVTNDTGPMHLAACAGASIVLLMDERAPTTYLPVTDKLAVIRNSSIDAISVGDVHREVIAALGSEPVSIFS